MIAYNIYFKNSAEKELKRLDRSLAKKILENIKSLKNNPVSFGSKRLKGEPYFRIRIGDYRVVYEVNTQRREIVIYRVRHRKDVYRNL